MWKYIILVPVSFYIMWDDIVENFFLYVVYCFGLVFFIGLFVVFKSIVDFFEKPSTAKNRNRRLRIHKLRKGKQQCTKKH